MVGVVVTNFILLINCKKVKTKVDNYVCKFMKALGRKLSKKMIFVFHSTAKVFFQVILFIGLLKFTYFLVSELTSY